jgi:hypothetical protein
MSASIRLHNKLAGLALAAATALASLPAHALKFVSLPQVERNPNDRVPLAAVLSLQADVPVSTEVVIGDGLRSWTVRFPLAAAGPTDPLLVARAAAEEPHIDRVESANPRMAVIPWLTEEPIGSRRLLELVRA